MIPKCALCHVNDAINHPIFGYIYCDSCNSKEVKRTAYNTEFTSDEIKDMRKSHRDAIIQPYREGKLSKEYIQKYGTKHLKVDRNDIKTAQNTWSDSSYYKE